MYETKEPFVEELRTIGEANPQTVFVARNKSGEAFIAEPNPKPPPSVRIVEVRDTVSMINRLGYYADRARAGPPQSIIFFGEPEAHVRALTLGLATPDAPPAALARELTNGNSAERVSGVLVADKRGKLTSLRTISESFGVLKRRIFERTAQVRPREAWARTTIESVESHQVGALLERAQWNVERDGTPTAVRLTLGREGGAPEVADIVAGLADNNPEARVRVVRAAHEQAVGTVDQDGATLVQYIGELRAKLHNLSDEQLKRLIIVIHDGDEQILFTRATRIAPAPSAS